MPETVTIRNGSTRWTVRADLVEPFGRLIEEAFSTLKSRAAVSVVKENLARTVYRIPFSTDHGKEIILKDYRIHRWDQRLRYFFLPSKARAEWRAMRKLQERDFPTATPLGYAESRSRGVLGGCSFASVAIPDAVSFPDRFRETAEGDTAGREGWIRSLGGLAASLHAKGAYHRDLHVGNVLVAGDDLYLVDLHRAIFPPTLHRWMRQADLVKLCHSLTFLTDEDGLRLLVQSYTERERSLGRAEEILPKILRRVTRLERERIRSRSLRCVKESSDFHRARIPGGVLYHRREWPEEVLRAAIASHREAARGGERLIKATARARVTRIETPRGEIAVKEYLYPRWRHRLEGLFRSSPARRAYIAGRGLEELHIPTPRVVGLQEQRRLGTPMRSFLMTEFVPGESLEAHFKRYNDPDRRDALSGKRRTFIKEFAGAVRRIHDSGVYQPDMAGQNFLVEDGGEGRFFLVDLDRVRLGQRITDARRRRSLSQIGHMPGTLTRADRLHFLRAYARGDSELIDRETLRVLSEMIDRKAIDQEKRIARILSKQSRG